MANDNGTARKVVRRLHGDAKSQRDAKIIDWLNERVSLEEVARRSGLTVMRVRQIQNESGSGRTRLIIALQKNADRSGVVTLTPIELVRELAIDTHNMTHLLHQIRKAGLITFVESHQGSNGANPFKSIKLTSKGQRWTGVNSNGVTAIDAIQRAAEKIIPFRADPEPQKADLRDVSVETHFVGDDCPGGHLQEPEAAQGPVPDSAVVASTAQTVVSEPETAPEELPELNLAAQKGFELMYPLLARLRARKEDLKGAADVLDRHGFTEQALAILESSEPTDPLEKEILRYMSSNGD